MVSEDRGRLLAEFEALLQRAAALGDSDLLDEMQRLWLDARRAPTAPINDDDEEWQGLIGTCAPMLELRKLITKFAPTDASVLITGESGTGKECVATALHAVSSRRNKPLVAENCAAIPETLLESVLFGHVRGAFTGAVKDHPGHFVAANGGTLFLDEIGDMRLSMQVKLLRTLQENEVRPVGGAKVRKINHCNK